MTNIQQFLASCCCCGNKTSRKYARQHDGKCKVCVTGQSGARPEKAKANYWTPERIADVGYQAYAREEGHYDFGGDQ